MQSSEIVLYNLSKQAMKDGFEFDRLYRHLYNEDFYIKAYTKIKVVQQKALMKKRQMDLVEKRFKRLLNH